MSSPAIGRSNKYVVRFALSIVLCSLRVGRQERRQKAVKEGASPGAFLISFHAHCMHFESIPLVISRGGGRANFEQFSKKGFSLSDLFYLMGSLQQGPVAAEMQ